jgi:hypothetical protein
LHHHLIKRYRYTHPRGACLAHDAEMAPTCADECSRVGSFLDYVSGGCEISVMVAIDFTASNGYSSSASPICELGQAHAPLFVRCCV